ncbi:TonB-dependent receptor [Hymenobacter aerilatus]|uniref:TonB-dependent receptor n=1 Tax=Hymenobacter aerilatus TaxID=2932251 RepID=A0A8T9SS13_9BACT|nr:TonB-dependent receptor [Hymenobacter aerilatus]UOR04141.1 TonB-dependent receptor [Hymenobacter aerilatus]
MVCLSLLLVAPGVVLAQQVRPTPAPADTARKAPIVLHDVVVAASKVQESILKSPVTVEKLGLRELRLTPAPSFFDAIEHVKGVQVITPSLGFKVINARGFTNTTNVRFVQLVDGMDNQAPHLGAPIGNAMGPSDLDIQSVEIVPGTAAALYGLNAINGLANFATRNPFTSEGLSVQQKTGLNHLNDRSTGVHPYTETSLRYAKVLLVDKLAFKLNATYLRGYDWVADNYTDINPNGNATTGLFGADNPAKDPVSSYGNESSDRSNLTLGGKTYQVARTGYREQDVTDYTLQTIKTDGALHYKLNSRTELAYTYRFSSLDNIYQRSNRFRLQDYRVQQHGISLNSPVVQARAYLTRENTGRSYNLRSMGENLERSFKPDAMWNREYTAAWNAATQAGQTVAQAHATARAAADAGRLQPGTPAFQDRLRQLQNINNWDRGAALRVQSDLIHAEGQVNVAEALRRRPRGSFPQWLDLLAGADHRTYVVVPDGNYFRNPNPGKDPLQDNLTYSKTGGFVQVGAHLWQDKVRLTATGRADKNDYFSTRFNPRFTAVYSPTQRHNFRLSYQSGYRFPSLFEGFSNVNSGQVQRVGGLRVMSNGVFENSYLRTSIDAFNAAVTRGVNTGGLSRSQAITQNQGLLEPNTYTYLKPEYIKSLELGYKTALLPEGRLLVDVDFYYNAYRDFIAQVEAYVPITGTGEVITATGNNLNAIATALSARASQSRYRLWTNSKSQVYNYGGSAGIRYSFLEGYQAGANATYARLDRTTNSDGLEDGFNTPRWAYNLSLGNPDAYHHFGFGLNYHWQDRYYSQTFLVNGYVPAFSSLDAQVSYALPKPQLNFKLGATNMLNKYYYSFLGGPSVGGLYYLTVTYQVL